MRVGTLLLANAFLLAAMATAYRASRPSSRAVRPDPTARRVGRRLLAAALVCFAVHLVVLGVEGV